MERSTTGPGHTLMSATPRHGEEIHVCPVKYLRLLSICCVGTAPFNSPNPPSWPNTCAPAVVSVSRCGLAAHLCCVWQSVQVPTVRFLARQKCLLKHGQSIPEPKSESPGATNQLCLPASWPRQPHSFVFVWLSTTRQRFFERDRTGKDLHYSVDMGSRLAGGDAPDCCRIQQAQSGHTRECAVHDWQFGRRKYQAPDRLWQLAGSGERQPERLCGGIGRSRHPGRRGRHIGMEQHARPAQGGLDQPAIQAFWHIRRSGHDADLLQQGHVREGRDQGTAGQFPRIPDGLRATQACGLYTHHVERRLPEHAWQRSLQLWLCQQCGGSRASLEAENRRWHAGFEHAPGSRYLCQDFADGATWFRTRSIHGHGLR